LDNFEAVDLSKGLYKITYPTEMLNRGKVRAFIQIIDSGKLAGTRNIEITVDRGVGDDTAIASSDSFTALAQALIDVNNLESTYAPRLLSAEQQLAEVANTADATQSAALGTELVSGTGWTVPSGWTGDFANGFVNTIGNLNPLTFSVPELTGTKLYQIAFRVESPTPAGVPNASTDFTVQLGNSEPFVTYQGGGNFDYTFGIQSVSDGNLVFNPGATFDGTIKKVSVKEITGEITPTTQIKNDFGTIFYETRTTVPALKNIYIGKESGKKNTSGRQNVSLGDLTLTKNTSGYWNSALGEQALEKNTTGSRNVGLGYLALQENISGDRNVAIGTFALQRNTHGRQNIALGADCLWVNTTGNANLGMGMGALGSNTIGNNNIALGFAAMEANISGNDNIAIGYNALYYGKTADQNIGIGREALKNATAANNVALGSAAGAVITTGYSNTAFGHNALSKNNTGAENSVFGHYAAASGGIGAIAQNTIFGAWAGNVLTTGGNNNTLIGYGAGRALTTGNNNILIGRNVEATSATASGELNIGNVIKSNIFTKRMTIGDGITNPTARLHLPAQSATAQSAPIKFNSGVLMDAAETGSFEFDGTKLYFTINGNIRKTIAFVA